MAIYCTVYRENYDQQIQAMDFGDTLFSGKAKFRILPWNMGLSSIPIMPFVTTKGQLSQSFDFGKETLKKLMDHGLL